MSKTMALRTELQRVLKTLATNVNYAIAPDSAVYPYAVFALDEMTYSDGKTTYQLEINVLDYGTSTAVAEILADGIQGALNKYHFINTEIQFSVYKGQRQYVQEDDKRVIRVRLLFEIQLHERGE